MSLIKERLNLAEEKQEKVYKIEWNPITFYWDIFDAGGVNRLHAHTDPEAVAQFILDKLKDGKVSSIFLYEKKEETN